MQTKSCGVTIQKKPLHRYFHFHVIPFIQKVVITFGSLDEILQCYHSNETVLPQLLRITIYILTFYKKKFRILLTFLLWSLLGLSKVVKKFLSHTRNFKSNEHQFHIKRFVKTTDEFTSLFSAITELSNGQCKVRILLWGLECFLTFDSIQDGVVFYYCTPN